MRRGVALLLMDEEEFRGIVADAIDALPEPFRRHIGGTVEVLVEQEAGPGHFGPGAVVRGDDGCLRPLEAELYPRGTYEMYGLYHGVPLPARGDWPQPPSTITIFMGPCLRANADEDALRFQVRNLVEHELGHHFGLTEAEVGRVHDRKRGQERKNPGY